MSELLDSTEEHVSWFNLEVVLNLTNTHTRSSWSDMDPAVGGLRHQETIMGKSAAGCTLSQRIPHGDAN